MGTDALVDVDQDTWAVLAKYNLVLGTLFGLTAVWVRTAPPANPELVLLVENGVFAVLFGAVQTYAWLSSYRRRAGRAATAGRADSKHPLSRPARRSRSWA